MRGSVTRTLLVLGLCCTRAASGQVPPAESAADLGGTTWQLVRFQGTDDTSRSLDDRANYQIEFRKGGSLTARIDCNRGRGTWTSSGPGRIELGPMALTRAMCGPRSLHDQIVKHWSLIRSYALRGGHLFLAVQPEGGTYEFEPVPVTAR
jgi:para-nitrobenzyl esterase